MNRDKRTLPDVDLYEINRPCLYYAMRRTGVLMTADEFAEKECVYTGEVEIGDVLVWHIDDPEPAGYALSIGKHGPIHDILRYDRHYGVYEGDGLVSDTIMPKGIVFIRQRRLACLQQQPKGIIRYADTHK